MFPMLAVVNVHDPIIRFFIIGVLVGLALYFVPRWIPMDAAVWKVIRIVCIVALVLWALALFGIL